MQLKFRKKPVIIEAIYYDGNNSEQIHGFLNQEMLFSDQGGIPIYTLEGTLILMPGNYLIKGIKGEFYPCQKDIFEQTYEAVE